MDSKQHWEQVYAGKSPSELGWHAEHLEHSLALLRQFGPGPGASLIDVGGGSSTLVDDVLSMGYRVTVADVAATGLNAAQSRLADNAADVTWMCADILTADFEKKTFDVWHDRAVFHFLKTRETRARYLAQLMSATHRGSLVIMATFSKSGPDHCSGLPVQRHSPKSLDAILGCWFAPLSKEFTVHRTPRGTDQSFLYAAYRRVA